MSDPNQHSAKRIPEEVEEKFTLERAVRGYDDPFRRHLTEQLIATIVTASTVEVDGQKVCCLRTGETIDATVNVLITVMAMVADHDVPSILRKNCEALAKKVRKAVAETKAEGLCDWAGAGRGGHA